MNQNDCIPTVMATHSDFSIIGLMYCSTAVAAESWGSSCEGMLQLLQQELTVLQCSSCRVASRVPSVQPHQNILVLVRKSWCHAGIVNELSGANKKWGPRAHFRVPGCVQRQDPWSQGVKPQKTRVMSMF